MSMARYFEDLDVNDGYKMFRLEDVEPDDLKKMQLNTASCARDSDDLIFLLDMLGLRPSTPIKT